MQQTLKLDNKKGKKSSFYEEKSLVGFTPELATSDLLSFSLQFLHPSHNWPSRPDQKKDGERDE